MPPDREHAIFRPYCSISAVCVEEELASPEQLSIQCRRFLWKDYWNWLVGQAKIFAHLAEEKRQSKRESRRVSHQNNPGEDGRILIYIEKIGRGN